GMVFLSSFAAGSLGGTLPAPPIRLRPVIAVVNRFRNANPYIQQAQPGDEAAHRAVVHYRGQRRVGLEPEVVVPDPRPPGEDGDQHAQVDAEQDEHKQRQPLQPDGRGRDGRFRGSLRRGGFGGGRDRWGGRNLWRQRHRTPILTVADAVAGFHSPSGGAARAAAAGTAAERPPM